MNQFETNPSRTAVEPGGKSDLDSREKIERLVDTFYDVVRVDPLLGPIFEDVAKVNWAAHLPRMYDFWESVLFGVPRFKGNPLQKHIELSTMTELGTEQFTRWLELFRATVDGLFEGPVASQAVARAERIAQVMMFHIGGLRRGRSHG